MAAHVSHLAWFVVRRLEGWVFTTSDGASSSSPASPSWHLSRWFVAEATVFNMTVIFFALFFWVINRQTHIKKTKGSSVTHKRGDAVHGDMSEEKFQDAAALKAWLKGKGVDDDDAFEAANQLFAKGFNKPSTLLNITFEILKSEGVADPLALELSHVLKEQQWQQHNPFEGDNAARALQDVLQKCKLRCCFCTLL
jgi:hypothetical protein